MSKEVKVLGIIPARGGSKGLPGKNIRYLGDKPLIAHTIQAARASRYLDRVIVTTDDFRIREISLLYGAEAPFIRPKELAQDQTPTVDALIHCIEYLKQEEGYTPDYICLLQCTVPLRNTEDIDGCITTCIESKYHACLTVCEAESKPNWMRVFSEDRLNHFIPEQQTILRRQDLPPVYQLNGAVYVIRLEDLMRYKSVHIEETTGYIMPIERSIDIDTEMDFVIAEAMMNYNISKVGGDN